MKLIHRCWALGAAGLISLCAASSSAAPPSTLLGVSPAQQAMQLDLEQRFDGLVNPNDMQAWLQRLSSAVNQVGAPHNQANAEFIMQQLRAWGWRARMETFKVLYPTLQEHHLELLGATPFVAALKEPPVEGDSSPTASAMEAYASYGADGDVIAELVYVNYGMPEDYQELKRRNIDVTGKIVIVRYGGGWRGLKPKLAQQHGAVGCIIYSDPQDDGYAMGDVYPQGGWRSAQGIQRGSVLDMQVSPGDPLTPGWGATSSAQRLSIKAAPALMKIPVLPISYGDALPLLTALSGPVAPVTWRGALPITYHLGSGPARVHMQVRSTWQLKTIYDVVASIPGSTYPDEWVMRGNHRDAWVFGAFDPLSGQVSLLAEAKALGALVKAGWRPKRTLVYASWDAEEPGLIGSVEWVETHLRELQRKLVLYVNSDTNARGFLSAGGSASLQTLVNEVARSVSDPQTGVSVKARSDAARLVAATAPNASAAVKEAAQRAGNDLDFTLRAMGAGSDFTAFVHHLGAATVDISYGGESDLAGIYHSAYDSYDDYLRFGDPGFAYGVAEAQTVGRMVMRMANAEILPMRFNSVAEAVARYTMELHDLLDNKRRNSAQLTAAINKNAFALAADPTRPLAAPEREPEVPALDFAALDSAVTRLTQSAAAFEAAATLGPALTSAQQKKLNAILASVEHALLTTQGLPGRPWYKNYMNAPGLFTGYEAKTLPAVREAIEANNWREVEQQLPITAGVLTHYAQRIEQATAVLLAKPESR